MLRLLRLFHSEDIAGQLDEVAACLSADATYQPVVPLAQLRQGRDAIVEALRGQAGRYKNCVCRVQALASTDSVVFTERTDTVTMLADLAQVVVRGVGVFEVDEQGQARCRRGASTGTTPQWHARSASRSRACRRCLRQWLPGPPDPPRAASIARRSRTVGRAARMPASTLST